MKKIAVLATGGTIACVKTDNSFAPALSGEDLIATIPELSSLAEIMVRQIMNIDSSDMRVSDWRTIARACITVADRVDGIVITHGTDTMCYTAAALSFMLSRIQIPVVLTGSQLPLLEEGSDGPINLLDACRVATVSEPGVRVVFNHKIINGCRAFKMYSKNTDAYVSRNFPYLGHVEGNKVEITHSAKSLSSGKALSTSFCEDVFLLKLTPASSPSILDYIEEAGYRGLVIEGFGTGGITSLSRGMTDGIRRLTEEAQIPVLMISQCPYDGVHLRVYAIGEQALAAGVISGKDMTTEAAVVKLMWALGQSQDLQKIREIMEENYCDELSPEVVQLELKND